MRAHHTPVGMDFIHHHRLQALEKFRPLPMMGQKRKMQHLRIGQNDIGRRIADTFAPIGGCVTVINGSSRSCFAEVNRHLLKRL